MIDAAAFVAAHCGVGGEPEIVSVATSELPAAINAAGLVAAHEHALALAAKAERAQGGDATQPAVGRVHTGVARNRLHLPS